MATNRADLHTRILADTSGFVKGLDEATRRTRSFDQQVGSILGSTLSRFTSVAAAVALVGRTIKDTTNVLMDFEAANSTLAAVLGTNIDGVKQLTQAAKDLGRQTTFTSTEVTQLQTSLARLGFTAEDITNLQEPVLKFAAAVGTDLASAADFTGSALRAFGLEAADTVGMLDMMAASTSKSALDFSKLQTAISIVAPVAHAFGLEAADTVAFLGGLANAGFDASSAATALRNILLNLADSNGKLAQGLGRTANTFPEIIAALQELRDRGVDLNTTLEMTDKRSVAAFNAFIDGADSVDALHDSLTHCNGTLEEMYGVMTDNLLGTTKALESAWEGLQLAMGDTSGIRAAKEALTDLLNRLTDLANGDNVGFLEMLLGPMSGSYIQSQINKKRSANAEDLSAHGLGSGGGSRGATVMPSSAVPVVPAASATTKTTSSASKSAQSAGEQLISRWTSLWDDLDKVWENELRDYESSLMDFADELQPELDTIQQSIIDALTPDMDEGLQSYLDMQLDGISDSFNRFSQISEETASVIQQSMIDSLQELANTLAGIDGSDATSVLTALLSPLADLAITAGTIILTTGEGLTALDAALASLDGPVAVAAGAALIGIGVAAKAGLAALSNSSNSYSSATSVASSSGSTSTSDYDTRSMNVSVTGTLTADGSKLVAVINNTNKKKSYTT